MSWPMAVQRPSTERLEFGEGVLDGIEVGAIGREVEEACAGRFDQLPRFRAFVARQIIHDDDVAFAEFRNENLLHIGFKGEAVDRSVDHERRDEAAKRECADERRRFPVAMRKPTAAITAGHIGGGPGLVDEDQALGVEIELPFEPGLTPLRDVGTILLGSVRGLFLRVMACRAKKRWIVPKPKTRPCAPRRGAPPQWWRLRRGQAQRRALSDARRLARAHASANGSRSRR